MQVSGWLFVFRLALILAADLHAGHTPEVVAGIFAGSIDKQILFFVDHILPLVLAHFEVGSKLDSVSWAGVLAISAEDAARKIDAEEFRIAAAGRVLRGLQRDAIDGTGNGAQITADATLAAVGIAGQNNAASPSRSQICGLFRVLPGYSWLKTVQENIPQSTNHTEHKSSFASG